MTTELDMDTQATPETDEAEDRCRECGLSFVPADHARRLERQRNGLVSELKDFADDCAERADILDGNDGPRPNIFMHWQSRIEAALAQVKEKS